MSDLVGSYFILTCADDGDSHFMSDADEQVDLILCSFYDDSGFHTTKIEYL